MYTCADRMILSNDYLDMEIIIHPRCNVHFSLKSQSLWRVRHDSPAIQGDQFHQVQSDHSPGALDFIPPRPLDLLRSGQRSRVTTITLQLCPHSMIISLLQIRHTTCTVLQCSRFSPSMIRPRYHMAICVVYVLYVCRSILNIAD